jgi:predicted amidohydrolase
MSHLLLHEVFELGHDTGRGNLLAVEPAMRTSDYGSHEAFRARLDAYLQAAQAQGWLNERTVVVWPEHIGTWLVAAGEGERVTRAPALRAATAPIAVRHALPFLRALLAASERDRATAALFRLKARAMARAYQTAFSALARAYRVTMVAGSLVLPAPRIEEGRVTAGRGPLRNAAAVFGPDGRALAPLVLKAFPTREELPFTAPAPVSELPAFDTPAGRLGVIICADSWHPQPYVRLRELGVELLAVPSGGITREVWDRPWQGYNGAPPPPGVDLTDIGRLTEGEAWHKYALAGRMAASGARYGVNAFSRGSLWDLGEMGGQAALVSGSAVLHGGNEGAAVLSLWLD